MSAEPLVIGPGTQITLFFSLKLEDGSVIDSNFGTRAATFNFGDGSLLPGFEAFLRGLKVGDRASFQVTPEHGFGQANPNNVQYFKRSDFAVDMVLEPGLVISFADAARAELPGVVTSVDLDQVVVDFNHPLAGHTITFDVAIEHITAVAE